MRKITYECDTCHRTLSDGDKIQRPHISVVFGKPSGWASNHLNYAPCWKHDSFTAGIFQFCGPRCLAKHFARLAHGKSGFSRTEKKLEGGPANIGKKRDGKAKT